MTDKTTQAAGCLSRLIAELDGEIAMIIFEVCDKTNDEYCFPIGYFGTLEKAKKEIIDKMLNGFNISKHTDDYEKIEVFELSLGWGDVRKSVFCIEREKILDEAKDEFVWKTISV